MRFNWSNPFGKRKELTEEQIKFIEDMKEQKKLILELKARQDFLDSHTLIKVNSKKEAKDLLEELNQKSGNCSRLLSKGELKIKKKLERIIDKSDKSMLFENNDIKRKANLIKKANKETLELLNPAKQLVLHIFKLQANNKKFNNEVLTNLNEILKIIDRIIANIEIKQSKKLMIKSKGDTSLIKLDKLKKIIIKVIAIQSNSPNLNISTLDNLNRIIILIENTREIIETKTEVKR